MADDEYFVTFRESLAGRKAGTGAREKAAEERAIAPIRTRLARVLRVHTDERAWRRGAEGEERVGSILKRLPTGWHVFHDIVVGTRGANIDHLVVGPGGAYTLNTKNLTGNVWVSDRVLLHNGRKTSYLSSALREGDLASTRLSTALGRPVVVTPVLVIFANRITFKERPPNVHVVEGRIIKRWLEGRSETLSAMEALDIAKRVDDPATWIPPRRAKSAKF